MPQEALARNEGLPEPGSWSQEIGILNNKADALVHEVRDLAGCGWRQVVHEVVNVDLQVLQGQEVRGSSGATAHRKDVGSTVTVYSPKDKDLLWMRWLAKSRVGADRWS